MTYTLDCATPFELLQNKADITLRGYRYVAIGLTLIYWSI